MCEDFPTDPLFTALAHRKTGDKIECKARIISARSEVSAWHQAMMFAMDMAQGCDGLTFYLNNEYQRSIGHGVVVNSSDWEVVDVAAT